MQAFRTQIKPNVSIKAYYFISTTKNPNLIHDLDKRPKAFSQQIHSFIELQAHHGLL